MRTPLILATLFARDDIVNFILKQPYNIDINAQDCVRKISLPVFFFRSLQCYFLLKGSCYFLLNHILMIHVLPYLFSLHLNVQRKTFSQNINFLLIISKMYSTSTLHLCFKVIYKHKEQATMLSKLNVVRV